jgi:hypothetical protein
MFTVSIEQTVATVADQALGLGYDVIGRQSRIMLDQYRTRLTAKVLQAVPANGKAIARIA